MLCIKFVREHTAYYIKLDQRCILINSGQRHTHHGIKDSSQVYCPDPDHWIMEWSMKYLVSAFMIMISRTHALINVYIYSPPPNSGGLVRVRYAGTRYDRDSRSRDAMHGRGRSITSIDFLYRSIDRLTGGSIDRSAAGIKPLAHAVKRVRVCEGSGFIVKRDNGFF